MIVEKVVDRVVFIPREKYITLRKLVHNLKELFYTTNNGLSCSEFRQVDNFAKSLESSCADNDEYIRIKCYICRGLLFVATAHYQQLSFDFRRIATRFETELDNAEVRECMGL